MTVGDLLKALEGISPHKNVVVTFAGEDERFATSVTLGWNAVHICDTIADLPKDETVLFGTRKRIKRKYTGLRMKPDDVTDEMIERALRAFYRHTSVQNFPQAARDQMRAALEAALTTGEG